MDNQNNLTVPAAIIIAGALIAGGIYLSNTANSKTEKTPQEGNTPTLPQEITLSPITEKDHILGKADAPVVIVEFSDLECPFCKGFHETMQRVMNEYGKTGKVAWVYRHFPLDTIHSKARKEAEAAECAAELGGNTAFWNYIDKVFKITPSNNGLDPAELPKIAESIGLSRTSFEECLASGRYADTVETQLKDGIVAGVTGTPQSILITTKDGKKYTISGAQPYETVKRIIDAALDEN